MTTYSSNVDTYDDRRANPMGAYITGLGALIVLISVWLPWITLGKGDEGGNASSGYEADSIIPFVGFLAVSLALALLYATKRADRRQHRGLSLASMAVGLAWTLFTIAFFIDPVSTRQYDENVSTEIGLLISLIGGLIWTIGSFLLAKEPEGDDDNGRVVSTSTATRPVATTHTTSNVDQTHTSTLGGASTTGDRLDTGGSHSTDEFGQGSSRPDSPTI